MPVSVVVAADVVPTPVEGLGQALGAVESMAEVIGGELLEAGVKPPVEVTAGVPVAPVLVDEVDAAIDVPPTVGGGGVVRVVEP